MNLRLSLFTLAFAVVGTAFAGSAIAPAKAASAAMPAATPLSRDILLAELSRNLAAHFSLEGDLEVDLLRPWSEPQTVAKTWTIAIVEYPSTVSSSMFLPCRISADGKFLGEQTVIVRAALWRDVWATRGQLTGGSTFDPALLETRRVDLLRERDSVPAAVGDRSYIFARGVTPGHVLTWRDIARRPLVRKGDMVDVSATEGALIVTMKAVAMENGSQGDTVTVRNPESRKDFAAMVVDENHVQVRF